MPQQSPHGSSNDKYKRKLFVDNGFEYQEVKARIIEPYTNPTPQANTKEIKLINAPSYIQSMAVSSYKTTLTLMFESKLDYSEYMTFIGWGHKFYDERGVIYLGSVESVKTTSVEANRRYKVEVSLILIKKDQQDRHKKELHFQDVSKDIWYYPDLEEMTRLGIITTYDQQGQPVIYFRPGAMLNRAEMASIIMRTKRILENMIRE